MFLKNLFLLVLCTQLVLGDTDLEGRPPGREGSVVDACNALKEEAQEIRREGYSAIDKADAIREQAYRVKDEAFELKDEAYDIKERAMEARSELETTLVETLALMKSQATVTNLYIQEIRKTLSSLSSRMDRLEGMIEEIGQKVEDSASEVAEKVSETQSTAATIKNRQQAWISEIRLISLYKMTEENNRHGGGYDSDLATDGQFTHDRHVDDSIRTYTHTGSRANNNKIWIELGGVFRIHKIKIWNLRHCCKEQIVGSHIYADDELIGTVIQALSTYDFTVSDKDPTYASRITLHQPLALHMVILELQVWGSGPFQQDDKFA